MLDCGEGYGVAVHTGAYKRMVVANWVRLEGDYYCLGRAYYSNPDCGIQNGLVESFAR